MSLSKRQFALQDYSEGECKRKRPCKHMDGGGAEDYVEETIETRVKMPETSATESANDAG